MGVVTSKGIVGIVENVSPNYSTVISILNSNSRINAQLKRSNHFGTLVWNGDDPAVVQLTDVPSVAPLAEGDTIITGGRSLIFPKGIPIGAVKNFSLDQSESYYNIDIQLFNDMTNIGYVYIIENTSQSEIRALQNLSKDE
jgi:rod shape-determining protein MreC